MSEKDYPTDEFDRWQMGLEILNSLEHKSQQFPETFEQASPHRYVPPRSTLESLIRDISPAANESVILGVCEDGLPLVLDLVESKPGSLLILGDPGSGKGDLICSILKSGTLMNTPRKFRFTGVLNPDGKLFELMVSPHAYSYAQPGSHTARDLILELAELVDRRNSTDLPGPSILFVIEDLAEAVPAMDAELQYTFTWLIQYGPEARIWTIAGLDPGNIDQLPAGSLESFSKCILGRINPNREGTDLAKIPLGTAPGNSANAPFSLSYEGDWLPFWLPD